MGFGFPVCVSISQRFSLCIPPENVLGEKDTEFTVQEAAWVGRGRKRRREKKRDLIFNIKSRV